MQCDEYKKSTWSKKNSIRDLLNLNCDWDEIRQLIKQMKREENKQIISAS